MGRENKLVLRRWPNVLLGYILAPFAAILFLWLVTVAPYALGNSTYLVQALALLALHLIYGAIIAAVFELVILTPLLIGYRVYRWRWLNTWTGSAIAFIAVAGAYFLFTGQPSPGSSFSSGGVDHIVDGRYTQAGLIALLSNTLSMGVAGAVGAFTFRLIAVRTERTFAS